jgi:hypothetical protein
MFRTSHIGYAHQFDSLLDRYGQKWALEDLAVGNAYGNKALTMVRRSSCNTGYFRLYFEQGSGMYANTAVETARREVVCRVFYDIANYVHRPTGAKDSVNIWIRAINNISGIGAPPCYNGLAGLASSFFPVPSGVTSGGITDNLIWQTINSGTDAYTNLTYPVSVLGGANVGSGYYHGIVSINFNATCIHWYPDTTWQPTLLLPQANQVDLYSTCLHEITHALGFATLIKANGQAYFGASNNYFSRYDLFLKTNATHGNLPLITNSGSCSLYNYAFNFTITGGAAVLSPNCASIYPTDSTTCSNAIVYSSAALTSQPVYTPACYEAGSSLSHFEDECPNWHNNNKYFLMSNAVIYGTYKRHPQPEEKTVLCDLGYTLSNSFGDTTVVKQSYKSFSSNCVGLQVVGINDGFYKGAYTFTGKTNTTITIDSILYNDYLANHFECLQDITSTSTLSVTTGKKTTNINFSSAVAGLHLLRYIPFDSATNKRGNITYIYVFVFDSLVCYNPCTIVSNGGFESTIVPPFCDYAQMGSSCTNVNCWLPTGRNFDLFSTQSCTNPSIHCNNQLPTHWFGFNATTTTNWQLGNPANTNIAGLGGYYNDTSDYYMEAMENILSQPLYPGQTYVLRLKAKLGNGGSFWYAPYQYPNADAYLRLLGSTNLVPANPTQNFTPASFANYTDLVHTISIPNTLGAATSWQTFTDTFTVTSTQQLHYITLVADLQQTVNAPNHVAIPSGTDCYFFIDDISIEPYATTLFFNPPTLICNATTIPNLAVYLSASYANGYFYGTGVSASAPYSFTPTGAGYYIITYHYTDATGCPHDIAATIHVQALDFTLTAATTICNGDTVRLKATSVISDISTPIKYKWTPSSTLSNDTIFNPIATPTATTTYSITITDTLGCTQTKTVQITLIQRPTDSLKLTTPICAGSPFTIFTNVKPTGTYTYKWTPTNSTATNLTTTIATASSKKYVVTVSKGSCVLKDSITVTIHSAINATVTPHYKAICKGDSVNLIAAGGNKFSWSPTTNLTTSTKANTIAFPTVTTTYIVTGTDSITGCSDTAKAIVFVNPLPTVNATATPSTVCSGATVTLATTGASTYQWTTSPTTVTVACSTCSNTTSNPTNTTTSNSTVTYTVKGLSAFGCKATSTVNVVVKPNPIIIISLAPNDSICSGSTATLTASGGASTYSWSPATGLNTTSGAIVAASPLTTSYYTVTGTTNGCSSTKKDTITIMPLPTINATALSSTICNADSVKLTATAGATSYQWTAPTGNTLRCNTCSITFTSLLYNATTSTIIKVFTVMGKNAFGCQTTDTVKINIKPIPTDTISVTANDTICKGSSATMTIKPTSGTYTWIGTTNSTNTYTVSPTATKTYKVIGIINGCKTDTLKQKITVLSLPIVKDSSNKTTICKGDSVKLSAKGANTYIWSPTASLNQSTGATVLATPTITTTYQVTGTTTFGCSNADSIIIHVNPLPTVAVTPSTASYCNLTPVPLTTIVSGGTTPYQYAWSPTTGLSSSTTANPTASPSVATTYVLTVTDNKGCKQKDTAIINKNCCTDGYVVDGNHELGYFISTLSLPTVAANTSLSGSTSHKAATGLTFRVSAGQTLNINQNFEFNNCNIIMESNSSINIASGSFLYLTNGTQLYACQTMWNGVYSTYTNSTFVSLYMNNASIKDAKHGASSSNGARMVITNSTFDRNYNSIEVNNYNGNYQGSFANNTITCSVPALLAPYTTQQSQCGFYIYNVANSTIGNTSNSNSISNCKFGIMCTPTISGKYYPTYNVNIYNNHFSNCKTGIYCKRTSGTITNNTISTQPNQSGLAVSWTGNKGMEIVSLTTKQRMNINNNSCTNLNTAILTRMNIAATITINNNSISGFINTGRLTNNNTYTPLRSNTQNKLTCGITNDETDKTLTIQASDNHIYNCNVGFYLNNLYAKYVNKNVATLTHQYYNNDIHLNMQGITSTADNAGFYLNNCMGTYIQCNTIDANMNNGDYQFNNYDYGIFTSGLSSYNFIDGNQLQDVSNGLHAENKNKPNYLIANNFDGDVYGMTLHNNGQIGDIGLSIPPVNLYSKTHWGNQWTNLMSASKVTLSYGGVSNPSGLKIYVRSVETTPYFYAGTNAPTNGIGSLLFPYSKTLNGSLSSSFPSTAGCETTFGNRVVKNMSVSEDMLRAALDTSFSTEEEGMQQFFERLALYHTLKQADSLREEEILANFEDMEQYQTIGKFYNAEQETALAYDSSLLIFDTTNVELNDSINNVVRITHLNNALNYLSDVNTTLQSVQYYQQVGQLYINYLLHDSLNESELQTSKDIAALCIYTYGSAINLARTLVSSIDSTITWDDNNCYGNYRMKNDDESDYLNGIMAANNEKKNFATPIRLDKSSLLLFPNPTKENINLYVNKPIDKGVISIYNSVGVKMIVQQIVDTRLIQTIQIHSLSNGIYMVRLQDAEGNNIGQGKFVINK